MRLVSRSLGLPDEMVVTDAAPDLLFQARTSEAQQVLVNLVKNAVEAVQEFRPDASGKVLVEAREDGEGAILLKVTDNGPGIPKDAQKDIFDPFFTTKAPGKGTGLGLNIVYRIVTKYRGTIAVESEEGAGASFLVRFPAIPDAG